MVIDEVSEGVSEGELEELDEAPWEEDEDEYDEEDEYVMNITPRRKSMGDKPNRELKISVERSRTVAATDPSQFASSSLKAKDASAK